MKYAQLCDVYEKLFSTTKRLEKTYYAAQFLKMVEKDTDKIILLLQGKVFADWDNRKIGVAARLVLKALSTSCGIAQEKVEEEWKKVGDLGIAAQNLIDKKKQVTLFSSELTVSKVFANLQKIATFEGEGTVDKKIQLISELLTSAKPIEAKYIIRTLLEEMRVGLGEGTLRDAIAWAYFAKPIGVFFQCENQDCRKIMPQNLVCLACRKDLNTKSSNNAKNAKILQDEKKSIKSIELNFDQIESHKKELHEFDAIISDQPREVYNYIISKIQAAFDITNDFSVVAETAKKDGINGLEKLRIVVGKPIKVMLALKEPSIASALERVGSPAAIEYKYDGFRMLIHKENEKIIIFTRRLENVTNQFPEVVELLKKHIDADTAILDGEAVGFDPHTKHYLPFQKISQRIKRKYDIAQVAKKFPVELNLFDLIYLNGKSLLDAPYMQRRNLLEKTLKNPIERKIVLSKQIVTDDQIKANKFYQEALKEGNEGVMFKTLDAPYKPGARVGHMVKLKSAMDPLDLVITGAEWGEGKRSGWLSSFIISCRDADTDELLEIGRVGTGIKEKETEKDEIIIDEKTNKDGGHETNSQKSKTEKSKIKETDLGSEAAVTFAQLTELLKPLIISEKGKEVKVKPEIVISILYEEIQKSPTYSSGYALRFPRLVALRDDRNIQDIATIQEIEETYDAAKN